MRLQKIGDFLTRTQQALRPRANKAAPLATAPKAGPARHITGQQGEDAALACLQAQGLRLVQRNFRAPGRGGGEIDLIMQAGDGTLIFVEVRVRRRGTHGGAGASIGARKRAHLHTAAQHFLARWQGATPPCRFDVVLIDGPEQPPQWIPAAFDAT